MIKFAVKLLKNKFYPLQIPDTAEVQHGQMVLVRTEKGEEAVKVFAVSPQISKVWGCHKPEALPLIRVMNNADLEVLKEIEALEEEAIKLATSL